MPKPIEKLAVVDGAPKNGKSWMVLDWCVRVAKGEPVWNLPVKQGSTLYLCLEDPLRRVQDRLLQLTDETLPADELQFSILLVHHLLKQGASDPLNKL